MEADIECPSGMEGRIRAIKVTDEGLYTDGKLIRSGKLIQEMSKRCWLETTSTGSYVFDEGRFNWNDLLQGDVFWIFVTIRRLTYGDIYPLVVSCGECKEKIREDFDLTKLKMQKLSDEGKEYLQNSNNPLRVKAPDGRIVEFRLLTSGDDTFIENLQDLHDITQRAASLMRRIVSVEGMTKHTTAVAAYVKNLDGGEADELIDDMEMYDCGTDTLIELVCKNCGFENEFDLPLQPTFFRKKKRTRKNKKPTQMPSSTSPSNSDEGQDGSETMSTSPTTPSSPEA